VIVERVILKQLSMKLWGSIIWLLVMIFTGAITTPIGIVFGVLCVGSILHDLTSGGDDSNDSPEAHRDTNDQTQESTVHRNVNRNELPANVQDSGYKDNASKMNSVEYTIKEKAAITYTLMIMTSVNGAYDQAKLEFASEQASAMGLDLEDPEMVKAMSLKKDYVMPILASMSAEKKQSYSITLGSSAYLGGQPTKNEQTILHVFLTETGIEISAFNTNMKKLIAFAKLHS